MGTRERAEHGKRLIVHRLNRHLAFFKYRLAAFINRLLAGFFVNDRLTLPSQDFILNAEHLDALGNPVPVNVNACVFLA